MEQKAEVEYEVFIGGKDSFEDEYVQYYEVGIHKPSTDWLRPVLHHDYIVHGPKNHSEKLENVMEEEMWCGFAATEWTLPELSLHLRMSEIAKKE